MKILMVLVIAWISLLAGCITDDGRDMGKPSFESINPTNPYYRTWPKK